MEKILISWLCNYTETNVEKTTAFNDLNFDIFDQAVVVNFIYNTFNTNINVKEEWFNTVEDLLNELANRTNSHV